MRSNILLLALTAVTAGKAQNQEVFQNANELVKETLTDDYYSLGYHEESTGEIVTNTTAWSR